VCKKLVVEKVIIKDDKKLGAYELHSGAEDEGNRGGMIGRLPKVDNNSRSGFPL
jgi:hypothetical protein